MGCGNLLSGPNSNHRFGHYRFQTLGALWRTILTNIVPWELLFIILDWCFCPQSLRERFQGDPFPEMTRGILVFGFRGRFLVDFCGPFSFERQAGKIHQKNPPFTKGTFWPKCTQGKFRLERIRETLCESGRCIDAPKKRGRVLKKRGRVLKKVCLARGTGGGPPSSEGGGGEWLLKRGGGGVLKNPVEGP